MNDRAISLLEQYDVEVLRTRKGRGAILCDTPQGCLIFKEYMGNEERITVQNKLLAHLQKFNDIQVETIIPAKEGALFVKDNDGVRYILKTYREGRECNTGDRNECADSVRLLAKLHSYMEFDCAQLCEEEIFIPDGEADRAKPAIRIDPVSQRQEYEKRNRELKHVRKYLKQRSQKTWFEIRLQQVFDRFMEQALAVTEGWTPYETIRDGRDSAGKKITYCHGDYQYHNILRVDQGFFVINFEKCVPDDPVRDLYLLMRKLLEKSNWSVALGKELLGAYEQVRPIPAISRIDLFYRFSYPEKFWKIANFYYNSGKAWIPGRNLEKLEKLVEQERDKQNFLEAVFQI